MASPRQPTQRFAICRATGSSRVAGSSSAGDDITKMSDERGSPVPDPSRLDGLPGPGRGPESDDQGRPAGRRGVHDPRPGPEAGAGERAQGPPAGPDRRSGGRRRSDIRYQLSGGMQQRVVIAIALASDPKLLVLDEPTTGLDATVEASVLDLVRKLQAETNAAVLLIAHNLGVIRTLCDRVGVMYAGKIVEEGDACDRLRRPEASVHAGAAALAPAPRHPQVRAGAVDDPRQPAPDRHEPADLRVRRSLPARRRAVPDGGAAGRRRRRRPVDALPPSRPAGEIVEPPSIVGADTIARRASRWPSTTCRRPSIRAATTCRRWSRSTSSCSTARLSGWSASRAPASRPSPGRSSASRAPTPAAPSSSTSTPSRPSRSSRPTEDKRAIQMVFQNPDSALNRGWTARHILSRSVSKLTGLKGKAVNERVDKLAADLRLTQRHLDLKPRQLSGGLKQRLAIARAFAGDPRIVVADEPTSALDVSVQAAILNLLSELQLKGRTSYLLISHDLGVVRYLADRIAGHLPRADHGGRRLGDGLPRPEPSVHRGAAVRGAERRRRGPAADHPRGRDPEPGQPADAAASSTRAVRASSAACARSPSRRWSRSSRGT